MRPAVAATAVKCDDGDLRPIKNVRDGTTDHPPQPQATATGPKYRRVWAALVFRAARTDFARVKLNTGAVRARARASPRVIPARVPVR